MSRINAIQRAILTRDGGEYQKFMDSYLCKKFNYKNIMPLGSHTGTNKVTKGIPDSYVKLDNGKYILIMYGTVEKVTYKKLESDIKSCLCKDKLDIELSKISEIICCHTSDNIHIEQLEQLENLAPGIKITLIGIGEVSNDLLIKYPHIANEFLSIPIDTGQIMDIDKFEDEFEKIQTNASIKMDLLHREAEINSVINKLENNDVVMVIGKSGVGKTRLTLEICRKYKEKYNTSILCITNKNQLIYNDLKYHISDEGKYLLFIDDANQITNIEHILEYVVNPPSNIKIKIILTVRDYAQDKLKRVLYEKLIPIEEKINILEDDYIKDILEKNLEIKNDIYLKQIVKIAKGNARLAILAGKVAKENGYLAIHNSADIFRYYYGNILNKEFPDKKYVLIAFLIALLGKFKYKENNIATKILEEQGIEELEFYDICHELHDKEILDLYSDEIIKISDQSIGDYLLYYVLYEKRYIAIDYIIERVFFYNSTRVIYALNTIISLFYSEELILYIKNQVNLVWDNITNNDLEFKYLRCFHTFNEEKALEYIYRKFSNMESEEYELINFDLKGKMNNHTIKSKYIEILGSFKYSSNLNLVVELLILFLKKAPTEVMDVYFTLTDKLGYDVNSFNNGYKEEYEIINELWRGCEDRDTNVTVLILCVIEYYLKYEFNTTESNGDKKVTFITFNLCFCSGLNKLRELLWSILGELYLDKQYTNHIDNILLGISPYAKNESNLKEIVEKDLMYVNQYILARIDYPTIKQCRILKKFEKLSYKFEIDISNEFMKYKKNKEFLIYQTLVQIENTDDWRNEESERANKIYLLVKCYTADDFTRFFNVCKSILEEGGARTDWKIQNGILLMFNKLKQDSTQFIIAAKEYINSDIQAYYGVNNIVYTLINLIGVDETEIIIREQKSMNGNIWMSAFLSCLAENEITVRHIESLYKLFDEELEREYPKIISVDNLVNYLNISNDIILNISEKILINKEKKSFVVDEFIGRNFDDKRCKMLLNIYENKISILEDLYMSTKDKHIDYTGNLFIELIKNDNSFIERYVLKVIDEKSYSDYNNLFFKIWEQENYNELINMIFKIIFDIKDEIYICKFNNFKKVFIGNDNSDLVENRKIKWIKEYIDSNYNKEEYLVLIFDIIVSIFTKYKIELILYFLSKNNNFEMFKKISLFSMFKSWEGSEIPLIEKEIDFLHELNNNIRGLKYIEHKAYLKQLINNKEKYKQKVLIDEYLEDFE